MAWSCSKYFEISGNINIHFYWSMVNKMWLKSWWPIQLGSKHVYFVVNTVPFDSLAPSAGRTSAGIRMTIKCGSSVYIRSVLVGLRSLTPWGRVTHICVIKLTIIGSDNGLSPDRRQAIIWTNAGILLIGPLGTNLSEIVIKILTFSFKKMHLKVSSAKRRPFCLGLNVLMQCYILITQPLFPQLLTTNTL